MLTRNFNQLAEYCEGAFAGRLGEDRRKGILGLTLMGELTNEPAFSDESNPLTQALRLSRHLESLAPQRLVIDWRLRLLEETPEALIVQLLKKLFLRRCLIALVIDQDADPATAGRLLKYCELKKSMPEAMEWLGQSERPGSDKPVNGVSRWATIIAGLIGISTFLFFVALSVVSLSPHPLHPADRFPAVVVLAFGSALTSGLFVGTVSVKGPLQLFSQKGTPLQISVVGGIATLIILLILGRVLFG